MVEVMNLKNHWFMRIADVELSKYLESGSNFGTNYFWNETLLGKMIPYNTLLYYNENLNKHLKFLTQMDLFQLVF